MPCWSLFTLQDVTYRREVLGNKDVFKLVIEAASPFGWRNFIGSEGDILGINEFGLSAPADKLFEKFGFTVENIVNKVQQHFASTKEEEE